MVLGPLPALSLGSQAICCCCKVVGGALWHGAGARAGPGRCRRRLARTSAYAAPAGSRLQEFEPSREQLVFLIDAGPGMLEPCDLRRRRPQAMAADATDEGQAGEVHPLGRVGQEERCCCCPAAACRSICLAAATHWPLHQRLVGGRHSHHSRGARLSLASLHRARPARTVPQQHFLIWLWSANPEFFLWCPSTGRGGRRVCRADLAGGRCARCGGHAAPQSDQLHQGPGGGGAVQHGTVRRAAAAGGAASRGKAGWLLFLSSSRQFAGHGLKPCPPPSPTPPCRPHPPPALQRECDAATEDSCQYPHSCRLLGMGPPSADGIATLEGFNGERGQQQRTGGAAGARRLVHTCRVPVWARGVRASVQV